MDDEAAAAMWVIAQTPIESIGKDRQ